MSSVTPIKKKLTTSSVALLLAAMLGACNAESGDSAQTMSLLGSLIEDEGTVQVGNLEMTTGGDLPWINSSTISTPSTINFSRRPARSGPITHDQESWLQYEVEGPGVLTFEWGVDSELNFDFLSFYINSIRQTRISGINSEEVSAELGAGTHTLRWEYSKDFSISSGEDRGVLYSVSWLPTGG